MSKNLIWAIFLYYTDKMIIKVSKIGRKKIVYDFL